MGPLPFSLFDTHRPRRVAELIGVVWLLAIADLFFTLWAHSFTPFDELNPFAAMLLNQGLFGLLVTLKIGMTFVGVTIFWRLRGHGRAELAMWAVVLVYVLLAIRWSGYTVGVMALGTASV